MMPSPLAASTPCRITDRHALLHSTLPVTSEVPIHYRDRLHIDYLACSHSDPLSFLLALCDEIQEWNRSRPDHTCDDAHDPNAAIARRVRATKLRSITVSDTVISATVEYVLPPDLKADADLERMIVTKNEVRKDQLRKFLKCSPLKVTVSPTLSGQGVIGSPLTLD